MGAAIALQGCGSGGTGVWVAGTARPGPARGRVTHLTLVPPTEGAHAEEWSEAREGVAVRLTRAGRLAMTVTVALLLAAVLTLVVSGPGAAASGASQGRHIVVQPGQTLSELAVAAWPDLAVHQGVVRIQRANKLASTQIFAGQALVIPAGS